MDESDRILTTDDCRVTKETKRVVVIGDDRYDADLYEEACRRWDRRLTELVMGLREEDA